MQWWRLEHFKVNLLMRPVRYSVKSKGRRYYGALLFGARSKYAAERSFTIWNTISAFSRMSVTRISKMLH